MGWVKNDTDSPGNDIYSSQNGSDSGAADTDSCANGDGSDSCGEVSDEMGAAWCSYEKSWGTGTPPFVEEAPALNWNGGLGDARASLLPMPCSRDLDGAARRRAAPFPCWCGRRSPDATSMA